MTREMHKIHMQLDRYESLLADPVAAKKRRDTIQTVYGKPISNTGLPWYRPLYQMIQAAGWVLPSAGKRFNKPKPSWMPKQMSPKFMEAINLGVGTGRQEMGTA